MQILTSRIATQVHSLTVLLFLCIATSLCNAAPPRTALVIGNGGYSFSPLANPVNDATDMAETLEQLGFTVGYHVNLDRKGMRYAIREFGEKLKDIRGVGLFYFAGHGVQIDGINFLLPIGADVETQDEIHDEGIDAATILRKMEAAGNAVNIVILDACRNNPFPSKFRSVNKGLARMEGPVGSFIAYATAPGSSAIDGSGRNGTYTKHLLRAMTIPGIPIETTFKQVRNAVRSETESFQIPWESSSLTGEFSFSMTGPAPHDSTQSPVSNEALVGGLNEPSNTPPDKSSGSETRREARPPHRVKTPSTRCSAVDKAVVYLKTEWEPHKQTKRISYNEPFLSGIIREALLEHGNQPIDLSSLSIDTSVDDKFLDDVVNKFRQTDVDLIVDTFVSGREHPITAMKTNLKTIEGNVSVSFLDVKTGAVATQSQRSFRQAGPSLEQVVEKKLGILIPEILEELIISRCRTK